MRSFKTLLAAGAVCALCGCSTVQALLSTPAATLSSASTSTATTVAEAEVGLAAAENIAYVYETKPLCPTSTQGLNCSLASVTAEIKSIAAKADADLALAREGTVAVTVVVDDVNGLRALLPAALTQSSAAPATK